MEKSELLKAIEKGFTNLTLDYKYKKSALENIELWLTEEIYKEYIPQIEYLVEANKWDLLLDSFYQVIPFGTGGRRGLVGIGPNRINAITIEMSAMGHSKYLLKKYKEEAKSRGVVINFDVRQFLKEGVYDDNRPNPVKNLSCKDLAIKAACVYAFNGIKVYMYDSYATTPELSYLVRLKNAVAGDMISASHNPPEYNGKKVIDETGGQLIPPFDEELVDIVVNEVNTINRMDYNEAITKGLIVKLNENDHKEYINAAAGNSISDYRGAKILFSPFHGTASTSVYPVLKKLGFDCVMDKDSSTFDPKFSSIMFNIPNPEVIEAYNNLIPNANNIYADIIITADPDGDRIGLMSKERDTWRFYNGNEIFSLVTSHLLFEYEKKNKLKKSNVIIKTTVTTNFIKALADNYGVNIDGEYLVGIKYIANAVNKLEKENRIDDFLIGGEESHGSFYGNYIRDKDTCCPAILISELASRLKAEGKTIGEYLDEQYDKYGYYVNYLTEIRLPGADGMSKMAKIQEHLRSVKPSSFGNYKVIEFHDYQSGEPFLSETDKVSRNVIRINFETNNEFRNLQVVIRPSGTEPKTKIYFEVGLYPNDNTILEIEKAKGKEIIDELEKLILKYCYKIIGIDFPDRGFLLFQQLDAINKMLYFKIEPQIEDLINEEDKIEREKKLFELLSFLGSNPIEKVDRAFKAKNNKGIKQYLNI